MSKPPEPSTPGAVRRACWAIRLRCKRLVCALGFGSRLMEFCEHCGREQPLIWHADNALWLAMNDGNRYGVYCPECFDAKADSMGVLLRWEPAVIELKAKP